LKKSSVVWESKKTSQKFREREERIYINVAKRENKIKKKKKKKKKKIKRERKDK